MKKYVFTKNKQLTNVTSHDCVTNITIRGNAIDFICHPLPKNSISDPLLDPPTTPGPRASHHLNPALGFTNISQVIF